MRGALERRGSTKCVYHSARNWVTDRCILGKSATAAKLRAAARGYKNNDLARYEGGPNLSLVRDMFWGENIAHVFFVSCFIASVVVIWVSLNRICKELNLVLPPDRKVTIYPPWPRSLGQLVWKTNILAHSLELLDQHRKYFPLSSLRKIYGIALISAIPIMIGIMASTP